MRGVEEKAAVRGVVMGEELQAKQACPSARTPHGTYVIASEKAGKVISFRVLVQHVAPSTVVQGRCVVVKTPVNFRLGIV